MEYEISIHEGQPWVNVKLYQSITADLGRSFAKEAIETAKANSLKHYLTDVTVAPNIASSVDQYQLAYNEMTKFGLDRESKIAVLVSRGDSSHDFIETVFRNAGYNCRLFFAEREAKDWLLS